MTSAASLRLKHRGRWLDRASFLRRVFLAEMLAFACGGTRRVVAAIDPGPTARTILRHLDLPDTGPELAPARLDQDDFWATGPLARSDCDVPWTDDVQRSSRDFPAWLFRPQLKVATFSEIPSRLEKKRDWIRMRYDSRGVQWALKELDGALVKPRKVLAVAGIGNPERFQRSLTGAGFQIVDVLWFSDHHAYSQADIGKILKSVQRLSKEAGEPLGVVTTLKDFVKLVEYRDFIQSAFPGPFGYLEISPSPVSASDAAGWKGILDEFVAIIRS